MKKRAVTEFIILVFVTFGIYFMVWLYKTKEEMRALGADIPTFFLFLVPLANIWWMWKWAAGVELVTKRALTAPYAFLFVFLLNWIGGVFVILKINETAVVPPAA